MRLEAFTERFDDPSRAEESFTIVKVKHGDKEIPAFRRVITPFFTGLLTFAGIRVGKPFYEARIGLAKWRAEKAANKRLSKRELK